MKEQRFGVAARAVRWIGRQWIACLLALSVAVAALLILTVGQLVSSVSNGSGNIEFYSIPSEAGLPNLRVGDHVVAWGDARESLSPQRGQIWVFKLPKDNRTDFIKRLIGLPGDRVQYRQGRLFLNGKVLSRVVVSEGTSSWGGQTKIYRETLPSGVSYLIQETSDYSSLDDTQVFAVPDGHYFFLGDNRDNSLDSRMLYQVGYVPAENVRDYPTLVYWGRT